MTSIKIFTDITNQIILMTEQQHELESKLIMLGFQRIDYEYNKHKARNYQTKNHFVRINLDSNTYEQAYREINTSTRSGITKHAINEIIQRMEEYDNSESN